MRKIREIFGKPPLNGTNSTGPTLMIPPVSALSLSNRAPTEAEVRLIRNSIAAAEFEIELIKNSPGFNANERQINSYKQFIHLQSALLFRQLPPVILKKIFLRRKTRIHYRTSPHGFLVTFVGHGELSQWLTRASGDTYHLYALGILLTPPGSLIVFQRFLIDVQEDQSRFFSRYFSRGVRYYH